MNDFLHNLRNQSHKRYERNRNKPFDGQYRQGDRHGSRDRKPQPRKGGEADHLVGIKRLMEQLLDQHRRLADSSELTALAAERQATALERIAAAMDRDRADAFPVADVDGADPEAGAADEHGPKAAEIIRTRRAQGASFEQIARQLNAEGIPTVSGRGQWRAQSVSRLFNASADLASPPVP